MRTILLLALSSPLAALLVPAAGVRAGVLVPAPSVRHRAASMVDETGKGAIGGAVLGGLLAGPFGALWGAQLGGSLGANARAKREDTERWQRMGVTPNMLDSAQRVAAELADAEEGLRIVQAASESQSSLMETLDQGISDAYAAAETSLKAGDEAAARERLLERKQLQSKRELVAVELAAADERVSSMAGSVRALQLQAAEIEAALSKAVATSTVSAERSPTDGVGNDNTLPASGSASGRAAVDLNDEDPLLRRFRELEGK